MTQSQAPPKRPEPVAESEVLRGEVRVLIESTGGMIVDKVPDKAKPLTLPYAPVRQAWACTRSYIHRDNIVHTPPPPSNHTTHAELTRIVAY